MLLRPRFWLGLGVSVLAGSVAAGAAVADPQAVGQLALVQAQGGEGGEGAGGEGGEGGEGGVTAAQAASDPVAFLTALDVIAAHYHAGRDAFLAGEAQAAGELFAHPIAEIYVDLEPVFRERGVPPMQALMETASQKALEGAPSDQVTAAAEAVLSALKVAATKAPTGDRSVLAVEAKVTAEMLRRAAAQYASARETGSLEPYLDGYGLRLTAASRADTLLPRLGNEQKLAAVSILAVLRDLSQAYPTATPPKTLDQDPAALLAAASRAELALSGVK